MLIVNEFVFVATYINDKLLVYTKDFIILRKVSIIPHVVKITQIFGIIL